MADVPVEELPALLPSRRSTSGSTAGAPTIRRRWRLARDLFRFHPLAIEDCFEAREHPKIDGFEEDYVFLITHGITAESSPEHTETVELDAFLGKRFLFTYHEHPSRSVAAVWEQVTRNHGGPLRRGPAAVLHAILDRQVESIEPVLEALEERIEAVEGRVLERPHRADLVRMLTLKRTTWACAAGSPSRRDDCAWPATSSRWCPPRRRCCSATSTITCSGSPTGWRPTAR